MTKENELIFERYRQHLNEYSLNGDSSVKVLGLNHSEPNKLYITGSPVDGELKNYLEYSNTINIRETPLVMIGWNDERVDVYADGASVSELADGIVEFFDDTEQSGDESSIMDQAIRYCNESEISGDSGIGFAIINFINPESPKILAQPSNGEIVFA